MTKRARPTTIRYTPPQPVVDVLVKGNILAPGESPQEMLERVTGAMFEAESAFGTDEREKHELMDRFAALFAEGAMSPGSPTLTNAGRHLDMPLSSCVVVPVDLRKKSEAVRVITSYYRQNMGSGFDFTPYEDPVGMLLFINDLSAKETKTGNYDRYIGNMGTIHVAHPKIREFVNAKRENAGIRHFNISVDVTDEFMDAARAGKPFPLADGSVIDAAELLAMMADNAWFNGDPGLINLGRMNRDNPVAALSSYTSTPPCSEMGLAPGETCQFGYVNVASFYTDGRIDYERLGDAVTLMVRALDNAVETGITRYPTAESSRLAQLKRKIGISACGIADLLLDADLPYDSAEGRALVRDVLAFINYTSKTASIALARRRGPCGAMAHTDKNAYLAGRYIEDKFTASSTTTVSADDWTALARTIRTTGMLRNILTTALPPGGRISLILSASPSIEPLFSLTSLGGDVNPHVARAIHRHAAPNDRARLLAAAKRGHLMADDDVPVGLSSLLATAKDIHHTGHLAMVAAVVGAGGVYDEAASKTVNLPAHATAKDIRDIFILAHDLGLKNISVYRDGSYQGQPQQL